MRIVMVVGKSTGGLGAQVGVLADHLRRRGHEVRILTDALTAKHFGYQNADMFWPVRPRSWHALGEVRRRLTKARHLLLSADIVHAHGYQAGLFSAYLLGGVGYRPPLVVSWHDSISAQIPQFLAAKVRQFIAASAAQISGSTSDLVEQARRDGARSSELVPIPSPKVERLLQEEPLDRKVRSENWKKLAAKEHLDNRGQLVLSVGRIEEAKRYDQLIRVMEKVTYPATAVVVGAGRVSLLSALRSQGTQMQVNFIGGRDDIDEWFHAATVLVVTSTWEARSSVVQEAMALGLPVIAPQVGGLIDLLDVDETHPEAAGVLIDTQIRAENGAAKQLEDFAQAVVSLLSDPSRWYELQRRARARAQEWETFGQIVSRWEAKYRQLCPHPPSARHRAEGSGESDERAGDAPAAH